jgi:hypothetical protein
VYASYGLRAVAGAAVALSLIAAPGPSGAKPLTSDAAVRQQMIRESIASYPGPCACPYNVARNGSSCGRRSAYSRRGGYAPICYASDISKSQVQSYRRESGL